MRESETASEALARRRGEVARAWTELSGSLRHDLGWRPGRRWALLLVAGAAGLALGWAWRRRR